jgi:hypothetical protein
MSLGRSSFSNAESSLTLCGAPIHHPSLQAHSALRGARPCGTENTCCSRSRGRGRIPQHASRRAWLRSRSILRGLVLIRFPIFFGLGISVRRFQQVVELANLLNIPGCCSQRSDPSTKQKHSRGNPQVHGTRLPRLFSSGMSPLCLENTMTSYRLSRDTEHRETRRSASRHSRPKIMPCILGNCL